MCGIVGIVWPGRPAELLMAPMGRMCAALHHRGPDGMGTYVAEGIALGHARLAIIDLSKTGQQPMTNEDGSLHVVVNGEIYNYRQLRADLQAHGHSFCSRSDSEVVLHLYEQYGDDCVQHLEGMFALALWDARRRRLLLARDRFGIKPLYFTEQGERLHFASELIALTHGRGSAADIDPQALYAYMALSYVPAPLSILRGAQKLLPAERMVWDGGRHRRSQTRRGLGGWREAAPGNGDERPFDAGNTRSALSVCRKHGQWVLLQRCAGRSEPHVS